MSVQAAIQAIRNCNTNDELNQIVEALKLQRQFIGAQAIRSFRVGDTVSFTESRRGLTVTGKVTKINRKTVIVNEGYTNWNVPAAMLRQAETA